MSARARLAGLLLLVPGLACGLHSCAPAYDVETLYGQLQSSDSEVRQDAEEKIARIIRDGRYEVFVRGTQSPQIMHRAPSIVYLSQMKQPEARAALRDLLRVEHRGMLPFNPIRMKPTSEESDSRILVAHLIAQNGGDPQALDLLLQGTDGGPADVRTATCYAVGALHDEKGVPYLTAAVGARETEVVRAAAQALGIFHTKEALEALKGLVTHPSEEVRSEVLSSLQLQEDPSVMGILETIAAKDPSRDLRASALSQLARFKNPSPVPFLIEQLKAKDDVSRQMALESLRLVSGQTYGPRPELWARWWQSSQKPTPAGP